MPHFLDQTLDLPPEQQLAVRTAWACLAPGEPLPIESLCNGYFTAYFEGDELLVAYADGKPASELYAEIEQVAGAKLVIRQDRQTVATQSLGFSDEDAREVLARFEAEQAAANQAGAAVRPPVPR